MARLRGSVWLSHLPGSAQLASRVTGDREIIEKKLWLKGWVSISKPSSLGSSQSCATITTAAEPPAIPLCCWGKPAWTLLPQLPAVWWGFPSSQITRDPPVHTQLVEWAQDMSMSCPGD